MEALGELRAAEGAYHSALEHDPDSGAARAALSVLAARRGDYDLARREAGRALALGGERLASAHLALAMADLHAGEPQRTRARLQGLLASPEALSVNARSMASTLIGDACDRLGDTAGALEAYRQAGAVLAQAHAPRFAAPGRSGLDRVKGLRAALDRLEPGPSSSRRGEEGGPAHVFLIGFPRSGTTLMGQILAAHPDVTTLDERDSLADAAHAFMEPPGRLEDLFRLDDAGLEPWRRRYWRRVAEAGVERSTRVFVDKLPMNALGLPLISRLFPHARILLMLRDPRDAVFSSFRRSFAISASTYELLDLQRSAGFYGAVMDYTEAALERFTPALLRVRYEDLIGGFDETADRVCRFMGLSPHPQMRDFAARAPSSALATPSAAQVARGLYDDAVGAWRRFHPQLAEIAGELEPWVRRYGYAPA